MIQKEIRKIRVIRVQNKLVVIVFAGLAELIDEEADLFFGVVVVILGVGQTEEALMEARVFLDPTKEFVLGCTGIPHVGEHQPGEF